MELESHYFKIITLRSLVRIFVNKPSLKNWRLKYDTSFDGKKFDQLGQDVDRWEHSGFFLKQY